MMMMKGTNSDVRKLQKARVNIACLGKVFLGKKLVPFGGEIFKATT